MDQLKRFFPGVSMITFSNAGGGGSALTIQDEGVDVDTNVTVINFIGGDVQVLDAGTGSVAVYIPPPSFASHFNTTDGTTAGTVSENISRSTAFIPAPTSEGNPFFTGGTSGSNQSATLSTAVTLTTGGAVTGFSATAGGNATLTVTVKGGATGSVVLETVTTSTIYQNGSYGSGNIAITISNYATDTTRYKADVSVVVAVTSITGMSDGGRYSVEISMTTDAATDGSGPYTYTQPAVFIDTNPSTPSTSSVTIAEGTLQVKHLSGLEYYILNSRFTAAVGDIDNLNRNTARTSDNLQITFTNYGISTLNQSPLSGGSGNANFTGWTSNFDIQNVSYSNSAASITSTGFRYRGTGALISARGRDTWGNGSYANSSSASVLIDTVTTSSTNLVEDFDDENRRQTSTYNGGNTSGNWTSTNSLVAGEALVMDGNLMVPSQATLSSGSVNPNFSTFKPDSGGANPNYTALGVPAGYYRTIVDDAGGTSRAGFTIVFTGTFVANATTDLLNENLQIFISRIASASGGNSGPTNTNLLKIHGAVYNFATFDDGATNGQIRESSSSGGTVNCTFGGLDCQNGFFMNIVIRNTAIKIDRLTVSFS
jgi:hypothetical protein